MLDENKVTRRGFLRIQALAGAAFYARCGYGAEEKDLTLKPDRLTGGVRLDEGKPLVENAQWYVSEKTDGALEYRFPKGALAGKRYLTADTLSDQEDLVVFSMRFHEAGSKDYFQLYYGLLGHCGARVRLPFSFFDLNKWRIEREGAWLKPMCSGRRVRLENVDRFTLKLVRKSELPARWSLTPFVVTTKTPEKIAHPVLPKGPLVDELGQMATAEWPGKTKSVEEATTRIRKQLKDAPTTRFPDAFSKWGGWETKKWKATGFFRCEKNDGRWWLVDPAGHPFWSAGINCVRVDTSAHVGGLEDALAWTPKADGEFDDAVSTSRGAKNVNYLAANLIRALGREEWRDKWATIAIGELKKIGFNSFGNWSDWEIAKAAQFPYTRPLSFSPKRVSRVYRDFPDVFDSRFEQDAADYAESLRSSVGDPAMIGYFMMNEPEWGFSSETPAVGMLYTSESCKTRDALADCLKKKYGTAAKLGEAWGEGIGFERVAKGKWTDEITKAAAEDLTAFSAIMTKKYFTALSEACRRVDPDHLNLGIRYAGVPPEWTVEGMRSFDVFSMNNYREKIPAKEIARIHDMLEMPVMIGEFHFGALDVGLPASGIGHVPTQEDRGKAYRIYVEDAAANPNCVGAHWFTLYDQSALGRFDGENYNIGFLDICNRPYKEISSAARATHEALYAIASGKQKPFDDAPKYLPKLYL